MNYYELREKVEDDIKEFLAKVARDFDFSQDFLWNSDLVEYAVEDVFETSAISSEGYFSSGDVKLACQRAMEHYLSEER